jgi:hypothetical protein
MKNATAKFYEFLEKPLFPRARILLALLVIPLALTFAKPLWTIRMVAPQYPEALTLEIYAHTVEAGHDGQDLKEINLLNHYIGMKKIDRADLSDLDWIPFAIGALVLFTLRVAAVGNVRSLVDLGVMTAYFTLFSLARFVYRLYVYGHHLDPDAPVKLEGFTPALLGTKQVANFTTYSYPAIGCLFVGIFAIGVASIAVWHLVAGRQRASKSARISGQSPAPT